MRQNKDSENNNNNQRQGEAEFLKKEDLMEEGATAENEEQEEIGGMMFTLAYKEQIIHCQGYEDIWVNIGLSLVVKENIKPVLFPTRIKSNFVPVYIMIGQYTYCAIQYQVLAANEMHTL